MPLFLTSIELTELTGYKLATKQTAWLQHRGYFVETNARGIPRITYTQIEEMRRINTPSNLRFNSVNQINNISNNTAQNRKEPLSEVSEPNVNNLLQKINK